MHKHFWNFKEQDGGERALYLYGEIAPETWWGDEVTPAAFRDELNASLGPITLYINSPGGDCICASQIYTMLLEYPGKVTVKIDGIAASAASVIAMAGDQVLMAPTSLLMVHNPLTVAIGDSEEMQKAVAMLAEVKESIINAYVRKTGLSRSKLSGMMDAETYINAKKAIELGFADGMLERADCADEPQAMAFSRQAVTNSLLSKLMLPKQNPGTRTDAYRKRLNLYSKT
jgi:ATP-dependent Clp protease protease subunit